MKPLRLTRSALLKTEPILWENVTFRTVYEHDAACAELYTHEIPEVSIVLSGSGVHCVLNQMIPCKTGDIFITRPDVPHGFFAADSGEEMTVQRMWFDPADWFQGDCADETHPDYCRGVFLDSTLTACATLTARAHADILAQTDAIFREVVEKRDQWRESIQSHLTLLLIMVERYAGDAIKSNPVVRTREWIMVQETVRRILEEYGNSGLTLGSIAGLLCVSQSHLSRLFRRFTGETFSDYLRNIRMDHACRLLKETDLSVEQIAWQCGLRDIPTFYRSFQAHQGMTPNRYRVLNTKQQIPDSESGENTNNQRYGGRIMKIIADISENLQNGKAKAVKELVQQALDEGVDVETILNDGLLAGMSIIGEQFKNNEVYIPEVMVAARAMNMGVQVLKPHLATSGVQAAGRVCIGTVQGDLHDIGKNLVKMMMEGKGIEVIDLGTDVPPEVFVQTAIEQNCQVICCSSLLTTTMNVMENVVKAAEEAGIRDKVKIMVGGAPVNEVFCQKIGADVYTVDAASAADAALAIFKDLQ